MIMAPTCPRGGKGHDELCAGPATRTHAPRTHVPRTHAPRAAQGKLPEERRFRGALGTVWSQCTRRLNPGRLALFTALLFSEVTMNMN